MHHTVVSRKRIFNKAEVLKAIENLDYEDRVALIAGELASGEKIQPKYDDDDEINDNLS